MAKPTTRLARSTADRIEIRGLSLADDLIGTVDFTTMVLFQMTGRMASPAERKVLDAVLVSLVEHGFTPSALATRLTYLGAPESLQAAVAAGLLGAGSGFLGSMEDCARLLQEGVQQVQAGTADGVSYCREVVDRHRQEGKVLPGFGHPVHKRVDPRTLVLLGLAARNGLRGPHAELLDTLSIVLDEVVGRPLTVNATAAVAAVLSDLALPAGIVRGFALIARCAGLVGHVLEEQSAPVARELWHMAETQFEYQRPE